ncbi:hypothetical protein KFK09_028070 [Dendrobium nobile]|uniref:Reverse transcriptase n=1 Tax=Dendrobium nobile TaxID=94219 RepID=A0A8T3A6F1_DENNO|nr:hypothetical protein KFK09_028070 [Dendrobium nobile]
MGSTCVVCKEKNDILWMCIDYRDLNKVTIKNKYPLSMIDNLFDQQARCSVFFKINLRSGYHQLKVNEEDVLYAKFSKCEF